MQAICLLVGLGGLVLFGTSVLWPAPKAEDYWPREDEAELARLGEKIRSLAEHRAHSDEESEKYKQEYEETEEKYAKQRKRLDSAVARSTVAPSILKWLGIFTALGGFSFLFWKRHDMEDAG